MERKVGDLLTLAERLRKFRETCGFSQQQIADKLNIHRATYSYYELGRTEPSVENLIRLAQIFNVTLYSLLGIDGHKASGFADPGIKISPEEEKRLNKLVGTSKVGELTTQEKKLILSFRTLTAEQRNNIIETMVMMDLNPDKK